MKSLLHNPPSASSLLESMRDIGYSLETAIADLIDNSLSANATKIDIYCVLSSEEPFLAIIDNGSGMNSEELIKAMKHGGHSAFENRSKKDLGRFGLGLKTASFSQCRSLTVVSKKQDFEVSGLNWDLDFIAEKNDWLLTQLSVADINNLPFIDQIGKQGTIVKWDKLDRLFEGEQGNIRDQLVYTKLEEARAHISLVFHRFLTGEAKEYGFSKVTISLNNNEIQPFDPFCTKNLSTQKHPTERVLVNDSEVRITPYILPHHSRLSMAEYDFYQDRSDFISNQGAYVYRNGRLMAWGDWFRIIPKGEATKLARVQIDFLNELDEEWTIDIKKSRAQPPRQVRDRLKQIIERITNASVRVHKGRGERLLQEVKEPLWERHADRDSGGVRYDVNRQHSLVLTLFNNLDEKNKKLLHLLVDSLVMSLPVELIYSDYSTNPRKINQTVEITDDQLETKIKNLKEVLFDDKEFDPDYFLEFLKVMPELLKHSERIELLMKEF